jgi:hypothetical protein
MSNLKVTLEALAAEFASSIIVAIKSASLEEIMAYVGGVPTARGARNGSSVNVAGTVAAATTAGQRGEHGKTRNVLARRRLARRSPEALAKATAQIVALLSKHPKGLRAEEIRKKLGISKQEIPRPLQDALAAKVIIKKGEKRATTYFKK